MNHKEDNHLTVMGMCAAAGLLVLAAVFLSSDTRISGNLSTLMTGVSNTAAVANSTTPYWKKFLSVYDGNFVSPHNFSSVANIYAQNDPRYGADKCGGPIGFCHHYDTCLESNGGAKMGVLSVNGSAGSGAYSLMYKGGSTGSASAGPATIQPGDSASLDWSCMDNQTIGYKDGSNKWCPYVAWRTTGYASQVTVTGPGGTVYSGPLMTGSAVVTPSAAPGSLSTYSIECKGAGTWKTSISVRTLTKPPEVAITGNGASGTVSVDVGKPVEIEATFSAGAGDTLQKTAINDHQNNLLPGVSWTPPSSKNYTFTPTAPGQYVFYPAVQTDNYPTWNNYSKSLTVVASLNCGTGTNMHAEGNSCVCNTFYTLQGDTCTISCPPNSSVQGGTCACDPGYNLAGTSCILFDFCLNVPGAQTVAPENGARESSGNCGCNDGYQLVGSSCVLAAVLDIQVNSQPSIRVRSGTNTSITWSASNVTPNTCFVRDATGSSIGAGTANPTPAPARVATHENTYTLTCTDLSGQQKSASATVKIIPSLEEV